MEKFFFDKSNPKKIMFLSYIDEIKDYPVTIPLYLLTNKCVLIYSNVRP